MQTSSFVPVGLALVLACAGAPCAQAQQSPFLGAQTYRALANEISGDIAFEHVRWFTHYHRPMGGGEGFEAVARYVEQKARQYGLEDVRTIKLPSKTRSWTPTSGELWLLGARERRLAFTPEVALSLADYSRTTDLASAELVDVGTGTDERDYQGKTVSGKVVLATGGLRRVMDEAVWKRGALGIVSFSTARTDHPDQVPWASIPVENADGTKPGTFAFVLSQREGLRLRAELASASAPLSVKARVSSVFHETSSQSIVEAVIRGTDIHDRDIVLTGHLQEERFSANDDGSGAANVLEIARALKKAIDEERLPRPRRDIRFWWTDEIGAEEAYFAANPEERAQFIANINQDMVGAKQSEGGRVQYVTRPPASRASYLGDVVESIVVALAQGNTAFLSVGQARGALRDTTEALADYDDATSFSRPLVARLGTREPYNARVIPFHNNTDHQVFNMGVIGIPGVTFTNWPDEYIHSTDDDLWQIDATQLKRNAVAVAAIAYYIASIGDQGVPELLTQMFGAAQARLAADTTVAARMIGAAEAAGRAAAYERAASMVRESVRRERQALESVRVFVTNGSPSERMLNALIAQLPLDGAEAPLVVYYTALTGERTAPARAGGDELSLKIPTLTASVQAFLDARSKIDRPATLHPLMQYEALNFVDGVRTVREICNAVLAEAASAGSWYYGTVREEDVVAVLTSAERAGVIAMKEAPARRR